MQQLYHLGTANVAHSNTVALSNGLVGYWTMDGPSIDWRKNQVADISGNGNTGTLINMSTSSSPTAGKIGQALKFDGSSSYVDTTNNANVTPSTPFSLSIWAKKTGNADAELIETGNNDSPYDGVWFEYGGSGANDNKIRFALSDTTSHVWQIDAISATASGAWHHIVAAYDGSNTIGGLHIYVDGSLMASSVSGNTGPLVTIGNRPWVIGTVQSSNKVFFFPGSLDDVRVYNRALSAQEVQQLYKQGSANVAHSNSDPQNGLNLGLVGYWTMDGRDTNWATGQETDRSGNGNTGTLVSMSTSTSPVAGKIGQALMFDGTNYQKIDAGNASGVQLFTGTIVAWIKTSGAGIAQSTYAGIIPKQKFLFNNTLVVYDWGGTGHHDSGVAVNDNRWHLVACSFRSGITNGTLCYVDAALVMTTTITVLDQGWDIKIGNGAELQPFSGIIDDARVYNRVLSQSEIKQLYNMSR